MNARDTQVAKAAAVAARIPRCVKWGHELAVDGWRVCACGRLLPEHADTAPDPAGGGGCGMCWRVCACCEFVDEHHVTEHDDLAYGPIGGRVVQVQPGGYLRHDVSAGLVLPNHRKDSEENVMVGRGG